MASLSRGMKARVDAALSEHGVRVGQHFVLEQLWREDGLTPGELAKRIGVETPTVTRAVQRMEAADLAQREPDLEDARLVRVRLTERGRELEGVVPEIMKRVWDEALEGFSEEEKAQLRQMMERVLSNLVGDNRG
ncbi:MAG: MarR family transcriptional regulator [Actinomycetota bacterium]|nr:MarR family transcriptional regulator [Actinomycetota bacterium]